VIHWTVCVIHIIILKVIFGVGKLSLALALASASKFCPRPRRFVLGLGLGLGDLSSASASASRICPRLTSLTLLYNSFPPGCLLTFLLNSSKTEFLIIGLKQQLSKIDNSSLHTTHSARNLGFYRAMQFSAKRGIAIACRLSVRLSVRPSVRL